MARGDFLTTALTAVKWDRNVADFLAKREMVARVEDCGSVLALWAKQLETADKGNAAIPFVRDMQASAQHVAAAIALALYRPAAYGMRCILEGCLYYSYFRVHPAELRTLATDPEYYLTKDGILEFHKKHTVGFKEKQEKAGLQSRLNDCYRRLSILAHGQIPGGWVVHTSLSQVRHDDTTLHTVVETLEEVRLVVNLFLLCTLAHDMWNGVPPQVRRILLKALSGEAKKAIGLSAL